MIGMTESELRMSVDRETFKPFPDPFAGISNQAMLAPNNILQRMATGFVKAISENNKRIEQDLIKRGALRQDDTN